ncbi:MAG: branched-chain amino acid ABC transporter permease [Chloroflexi bacterium]|nr:branched-chain amino acid ABC transporter permease [Chloroflexota bacterium]
MAQQSGIFHEDYRSDLQLRPTTMQRLRLVLLFVFLFGLPVFAGSLEMRYANNILIALIGSIGLNILVGFTGQISLGQGAFLAVGAYSSGLLVVYLNVPWYLSILLAGAITALIGGFFGLPSLRLKGLYLAVATLAAQQIVQWVLRNWDPIDGDINQRVGEALNIPAANFFGHRLNDNEYAFYFVVLFFAVLAVLAATNLFRTHIGRAFIAIRDQDIAAEVMGVHLFRYKLLAFATSSFFVGMAGALLAQHSTSISWESFTINVSIQYLAMIIIGGLGSVSGSIYGAIFITLLPQIIRGLGNGIEDVLQLVASAESQLAAHFAERFQDLLPRIEQGAFGLAIILTLILEPEGLRKLWQNIKDYFRLWPFSY